MNRPTESAAPSPRSAGGGPGWGARLCRSLVIAAITSALGCGVVGEPKPIASTPAVMCEQLADLVGEATSRCDEDYQANHDAFIQASADGDCANVVALRDESALRDECIPWLESASCADLGDTSRVPDGCRNQLLLR